MTQPKQLQTQGTIAVPLGNIKQVARDLWDSGAVRLTAHLRERLDQRDMTVLDVGNVIKAGTFGTTELGSERGYWKYKATTSKMWAAVEIDPGPPEKLVVLSAGRQQP